jgi:hypothetical protein
MPQIVWARYFIETQGFKVEECILNQDNLSAMLLEKNGKQSSSKGTKHIRVHYFFIKDRVSVKDLSIHHCPTEEMLTDHFTKPLQGAPFRKFRANIQGIPIDQSDAELGWYSVPKSEQDNKESSNLSPQECVGRPAESLGSMRTGSKIPSVGKKILQGGPLKEPPYKGAHRDAPARCKPRIGTLSYTNIVREADNAPIVF